MYLFLYHLHILLQFLPFCFAFPLFCPLFFIFKVVFTNFCHYFLPFVLHLSASSSFNLSLFTSLPLDLPSCCIVSSLSFAVCWCIAALYSYAMFLNFYCSFLSVVLQWDLLYLLLPFYLSTSFLSAVFLYLLVASFFHVASLHYLSRRCSHFSYYEVRFLFLFTVKEAARGEKNWRCEKKSAVPGKKKVEKSGRKMGQYREVFDDHLSTVLSNTSSYLPASPGTPRWVGVP